MIKRMLLMLLCVLLAVAGIGYAKFRQIQAAIAMGKSFAPPPSAVTTLVVQPQPWQPSLRTVGTLKAVQGVTVTTDLPGIVVEIGFESGQSVRKGDRLVQLENHQELAQLHAAEARRDLARLDLDRKRELKSKSSLASSEVDTAESELRQAIASLEMAAALLARKQITAPFDGVLGIRQVSLGQFVNPGSPIVTMHSQDPIHVQFTLPQHQVAVAAPGNALHVLVPGSAEEIRKGKISAIDSQIDDTSRSITVEGTLPNPDHRLRSGMFVNVELPLTEEKDVLVVPASAVYYAPYGDSIFVVKTSQGTDGKPAKTVEQQFVKLGEARGDQIRVLKGLQSGDEIVTSGVFKLRPGAAIQINNSVQPPSESAPKPPNT
ncbi:MAG: hypothetical protein RLZZ399_1655 [Verrucomicrobiota bacterium]|jgi:membrane fusion protein (multidrug efflux system)